MALTTREGFANTPFPQSPETGWTLVSGAITAIATSLTVLDGSVFSSSLQFWILIDNERIHVTARAGDVLTIVRGAGASSHDDGASVYQILTAEGVARNPGAMTDAGDLVYMGSDGSPKRLAAPANGQWVVTFASGVPSWSSLDLSAYATQAYVNAQGFITGASPTIVTPTIASFVNATHTHLNAAGGGTLTAAAISDLGSASVVFTNKSGNVSQWTNDASYTTLAAVAGVGYLTSVTAHNVLSATHGDTLAAAVVRGDLFIGNATPKWSRLAIGASGKYLKSDGTDVSWADATPGGSNTQVQFNDSGAFGGDAGFTYNKTTDVMTLLGGAVVTSGTITASAPFFDATQTWNNAGVTFSGFKLKYTMTAAASGSTLIDIQGPNSDFGGGFGSYFSIDKSGRVYFSGSVGTGVYMDPNYTQGVTNNPGFIFGMNTTGSRVSINPAGNTSTTPEGMTLTSNGVIYWGTGSNLTAGDTFLKRGGAAATVQMGMDVNGAAVAQTIQAANGITGTDKAGANLTIASGKGTGAATVSQILLRTPTVLASGTTAQSLTTRLTIDSSGITVVGGVVVTSGTITASAPVLTGTQTWNNSGVTFNVLGVDITNTSSGALSTFTDFKTGGTTHWRVYANGYNLISDASSTFLGLEILSSYGLAQFVMASSAMKLIVNNSLPVQFDTSGVGAFFKVDQDSTITLSTSADLFLKRVGAATLQFGKDVNGSAVSQTINAANGITGTDKAGGNFTIASGKGTGAGTVSQILLQTPTVLGSGTTAQSLTTRLTIDSSGIKATGYLSSDGSAGVSVGPYTVITSITVKNGLITALSGS